MRSILELHLLFVIFGVGCAELCSSYNKLIGYIYYTYCSGYCYGIYGYEECNNYKDYYEKTNEVLNTGAIVGIVIGSILFLVLLCTICVCACMTSTKTASGSIVYPRNPPTAITVIRTPRNELGYSNGQQTTAQYTYQPRTYESACHH